MAREDNLKPFTSENQPAKHSSRKGIPNRATVFKKWLTAKVKIDDPKAEDKDAPKLTVTLMEAAALGQIQAAIRGKTDAWKEIQDSIHGKQADKLETEANVTSTTTLIIQGVAGDDKRTDNQGS